MILKTVRAAVWLHLFVLVTSAAYAQGTTTGSIAGVVRDTSGGVLPGVTVTITNLDRGTARNEVTDAEGRYLARDLPRGLYEVKAELPGFRTEIRRGIELSVGREALVELTMAVGDMAEQVVVTGDAPLIDARSGTLSTLVTEDRIVELPLNSRDITELVTLEVGVARVNAGGDRPTGGFAKRITVAGSRPDMTGWLLDGTDIQTTYRMGPAGAAGVQLGVDAIQEVRILTNSYSAEFGTVGGGIVAAVTRSGSNRFKGTVFEFLRHSKLDAKNFFEQEKPHFRRDQYGASVGGPLIRNRTFFFGAFERLTQTLGYTRFNLVPSMQARQGILPGAAPIQISPAVRRILDAFPAPNGRELGGGFAEYNSTTSVPTDDRFWNVRVDHTFSPEHTLYGRFTATDTSRDTDNDLDMMRITTASERRSATVEDTWILSSRWLNKLRFGYNRAADAESEEELRDLGALRLTPFPHVGVFAVGGLSPFGAHTSRPVFMEPTNYELANDLSFAAGAHNVKFGVLWRRMNFSNDSRYWAGGQWSFNSLADFLRGNLGFMRANLPGSSFERQFTQNLVGLYVQDSWKLGDRVSADLGVRYELITVPEEANGRSANLRSPSDPRTTVGPMFRNPSLTNVAPRTSIAWTPTRRTSIRSGFGMFYDQILTNYYQFLTSNTPPFLMRGLLRRVPIDTAYATLAALGPEGVKFDLTSMDYELETPKMIQFNVNVQQQIGESASLQVGYVGSRGKRLMRAREANSAIPTILPDGRKFFPPGLTTRNPTNASDRRSSSDGESWYDGLIAGYTHRFGEASQIQASYTWSKAMDLGSSLVAAQLGGQFAAIDPDDKWRNKGLALFDVRHNFVFNAIYQLPWGQNLTGAAAVLAKGWQVGGIVTLQDGIPFTPTLAFNNSRNLAAGSRFEVPDLKPGASTSPVLGGHERYFDVNAFSLPAAGFFGNLGRNTVIGPGLMTVDASFVKNSQVGLWGAGAQSIQIRLEIFNLLNRANLGLPEAGAVLNPDGSPNPATGRIRSTSTAARQMQFGVKFIF